ncbi:MAG: DUF5615 family PIN-like protein [Thermodesulfobacteriota bacterium]
MKPLLLANENIPMPPVQVLRQAGYDVRAIAETGSGLSDREILAAAAEDRWVITLDRDYGELLFVRNLPAPPSLLYLRLRAYRPETPGEIVVELLREAEALLGQFVVVQEDSLRKRPLPIR